MPGQFPSCGQGPRQHGTNGTKRSGFRSRGVTGLPQGFLRFEFLGSVHLFVEVLPIKDKLSLGLGLRSKGVETGLHPAACELLQRLRPAQPAAHQMATTDGPGPPYPGIAMDIDQPPVGDPPLNAVKNKPDLTRGGSGSILHTCVEDLAVEPAIGEDLGQLARVGGHTVFAIGCQVDKRIDSDRQESSQTRIPKQGGLCSWMRSGQKGTSTDPVRAGERWVANAHTVAICFKVRTTFRTQIPHSQLE